MTIERWTPPLAPRPPAMLVLGCLGTEAPPFPQGALQAVRERLIAADLDRRLRERTVELAKATPACDPRTLPKTLRVAIDSSPLPCRRRRSRPDSRLCHDAGESA